MGKNLSMHMDHAVYWVDDIDGTDRFLSEIIGFKRHPIAIGCSDDDPTTGGMEGVFFDGNGLWVELIRPTSPGPGMDILHKVGPGALVEINFQPEDYDDVLRAMKERGIQMLSMDGSPLGDDGGYIKEGVGKGEQIEHTGQRIAYWPSDLSCGSSVEIFEVIKGDDSGLINRRDIMWANEAPATADAPWVSHIVIYVKDLEAAARFYTDVVGLVPHVAMAGDTFGADEDIIGGFKTLFVDARGLWLQLVQPLGPGILMDKLEAKGDGYLGETAICVANLEVFEAKMRAQGIQLRNARGEPLSNQGIKPTPQGDKIAYFPSDVSCGMSVMVFQANSGASGFPPRSHPPKA